jgi:polysaccharide biosynthesis transport protein
MTDEMRILPVRTASGSITARDIAAVFFRRPKIVLISFFIVLCAGVFYVLLFPTYQAEMKVLVRHGRIDPAVTPTETTAPLVEREEVSEEELNSEVELLQDQDVLRKVVLVTGLADSHVFLSRVLHEDREQQITTAVKRLAHGIDVQPVRKSHLIKVSYGSPDPHLSSAVLKALSEAYLARHVELRRPTGQLSFFEQQMVESRHALEEAESQLAQFTRTKKVASAALERDLTLQKMSEAESSDFALQASLAEAAQRVRSLETKIRELPERRVSSVRNADNPQLEEKLKSRLLDLQLERTALLTKFQPSYRLVEQINQQIAQAKDAIQAADLKPLRDEVTEANPEYEWANSERSKALVELQVLLKKRAVSRDQLAHYKSAAENLAEDALRQGDLERKLKAAEDKYLLYANKREEARIGDALDENGILNVAVAEEPQVPALPNWPLWAATCLSFAAACVFSTGVAFAADYVDPSFRTPCEVTALLGTPVLAALPEKTGS